MKLSGTVLLCAVMLTLSFGCGSREFDTSELQSADAIDKQAGKHWKRYGWWKLPKDAQTIAITEFTVEFVTQTGTQSQGIGLIPLMQMAGVGKKRYEYDETMMQTLPSDLYDMYVRELEKAGYSVVDATQLRSNDFYQKIKLSGEGDDTKWSSTSGRDWKHRHTVKGELYSAYGLVAADDGWFNGGNNAMHTVNAAGACGADTALRVRMKVGLDGDGRAVFWPGATVFVFSDIREVQWQKDKTTWQAKVSGNMASKQMLYFSEPVVDGKDFQAFKGDVYRVQGGPFAHGVKSVFPEFAALSIYALR